METKIQIKNKELAEKLWDKYEEDRNILSEHLMDDSRIIQKELYVNQAIFSHEAAMEISNNKYPEQHVFDNPTFEARTGNHIHFYSSREAKLFDAISEFIDPQKYQREITFIVDMVKAYSKKLDK